MRRVRGSARLKRRLAWLRGVLVCPAQHRAARTVSYLLPHFTEMDAVRNDLNLQDAVGATLPTFTFLHTFRNSQFHEHHEDP